MGADKKKRIKWIKTPLTCWVNSYPIMPFVSIKLFPFISALVNKWANTVMDKSDRVWLLNEHQADVTQTHLSLSPSWHSKVRENTAEKCTSKIPAKQLENLLQQRQKERHAILCDSYWDSTEERFVKSHLMLDRSKVGRRWAPPALRRGILSARPLWREVWPTGGTPAAANNKH